MRIVPADEVLEFCENYLKANKNYLFIAKAKDLLANGEVVPEERKITFGKYIGYDIDTVAVEDKNYFDWIVKCVKKGEYVSYKLAEYIENKYLTDVTCESGKFKKAAYEAKMIEGAEIYDMVEYFMTTTGASFLMAYKYLKEASVDMDKFIDNVIYTASIGKGVNSYLSYHKHLEPSKEGVWILYQKEIKAKGLRINTYTGMDLADLNLCIKLINQKDNALLVHLLNNDFNDFIRILAEADALWYVDENGGVNEVDLTERKHEAYSLYHSFPNVMVDALEFCVNGGYWEQAKEIVANQK